MSLYFSKILSQLIYPLGLSIVLVLFGVCALWLGRARLGGVLALLGIAWLYAWSTPVFSALVRQPLESVYPPSQISDLPSADVIIVLGGGTAGAIAGVRHPAELPPSANRVWHAARLFRAGKAPLIIVSGGAPPFLDLLEPEAQSMARFLMELGVPNSAILLETNSVNTYENAAETQKIMRAQGIESALLVTSALHMPRSMAVFETIGITPIAAATDYAGTTHSGEGVLRWLPNADALQASTLAFHEYFGRAIYRIRGWAS